MRSVSIRQLDMKQATIPLGFEGENEFTEVRIDCKKTFDQHPNAVPSMTVTDPAGNKYPAVVTRDGDIVVWQLTAGDLTTKGYGEIQIEFIIDGTVIGKTDIARTRIERSIFPEGEAPEPMQNWLDDANQTLAEVEEAKQAFPAGGTTGQVLTKKSDEDYDTEWQTPQGGGGGTSNYNDLDNKPSINGVTLTGNNSLSDLSIPSQEDVNAKYTKPQGGIPASDIDPSAIPSPTSIIDDNAGEGDTNKVLSADKVIEITAGLSEAIENVEDTIGDILVENSSESITLTNGESASTFYDNAGSLKGLTKTSFSDGTAKYTAKSENEVNPYVIHANLGFGTKKWLVGMKLKYTKIDPELGNPTTFAVRLGAGSDHKKSIAVEWGEWIQVEMLDEFDLTRIYISADGFASAPATGSFTIEIKDMYVYDVTDASADMIAYIKTQQASSYQDGTVTYSIGSSGYAPDTTLTEEGKAADAKAVGDAIKNATKAPLDDNLLGVAFGTSLTSRSVSSDGYLDYLPDLIGIDFDNQGIGSAQIKSSILNAIKAYTGYANKKVCIIEGFVNDWKFDSVLGTWKDDTENSACGCLRSAINYILSQNANITMFIVFDHYGRNYSSDDRSSTAENTANLTQYEYYEELAKVAESLGIPVIKQYAGSQISENTPQYLYDYIHTNALGAKQSANFIYSKMKQYFQNEQPSS